MRSELRPGRAVAIDWLDHFEHGDDEAAWVDVKKLDVRPLLMRSVGVVVRATKEVVALAITLRDGQSTAPMVILRAAIVAVHAIQLPPLRRRHKEP